MSARATSSARGQGLGRENGDDGIHVRVVEAGAHGAGVARGVGIAEHVHRIAFRDQFGGSAASSCAASAARGSASDDAAVGRVIGGHDAWAAGIRDDRQAPAGGLQAEAERARRAEEIREVPHAQHARPAQRRIEHVVGADQRARVGERGARSDGMAAGLHHDDRFDRAPRPASALMKRRAPWMPST